MHQPSVENLGLLSGDQFAAGSKGFIQDIDPFTLFGLFNRGIKDSNRRAIAADSRLGKAFQIGHSYATPTQSLEGRSCRDWFAEVVASELKPLLQEYWFDAPEEADRQAAALLEGW